MRVSINKKLIGHLLAIALMLNVFNGLLSIPNVGAMDNEDKTQKDEKDNQPPAAKQENLRSYPSVTNLEETVKIEKELVEESSETKNKSKESASVQIPNAKVEPLSGDSAESKTPKVEEQPMENVEEEEALKEAEQKKIYEQRKDESSGKEKGSQVEKGEQGTSQEEKKTCLDLEKNGTLGEKMEQVSLMESKSEEKKETDEQNENPVNQEVGEQYSQTINQVDTQQNEDLVKDEEKQNEKESSEEENESSDKETEKTYDQEVEEVLNELDRVIDEGSKSEDMEENGSSEETDTAEDNLEKWNEQENDQDEKSSQESSSEKEQENTSKNALKKFKKAVRRAKMIGSLRTPSFFSPQDSKEQESVEDEDQEEDDDSEEKEEDESSVKMHESSENLDEESSVTEDQAQLGEIEYDDSDEPKGWCGTEEVGDQYGETMLEEAQTVKCGLLSMEEEEGEDDGEYQHQVPLEEIKEDEHSDQGEQDQYQEKVDFVQDQEENQGEGQQKQEVYSIDRNNIVDGPEELIDAVLGFNTKIIRSPAMLLNVWPMEFGFNQPVAKIMNMELVDSDNLIGNYYQIYVRGERTGSIPLLINKESGDEVLKIIKRKETMIERSKMEFPELSKPTRVRKVSVLQGSNIIYKTPLKTLLDAEHSYQKIGGQLSGRDGSDTESEKSPFNKGYGFKTYSSIETDTPSNEKTTPDSDMWSIPRSGSSCGGVGIMVGEFSDEDMGHLEVLSEDVPTL